MHLVAGVQVDVVALRFDQLDGLDPEPFKPVPAPDPELLLVDLAVVAGLGLEGGDEGLQFGEPLVGGPGRQTFLGVADRLAQAFERHRLGQIVDGVHLKRLHRIVGEGRGEDHLGNGVAGSQVLDDRKAAPARHFDIQDDEVGPQATDHGQGLDAIAGATDQLDLGNTGQRGLHPAQGERFIVRYDNPHSHDLLCPGVLMRTPS